jgi:hypothetical protein
MDLILDFACNLIGRRTRGKVSTVSVDNSEDKRRAQRKILCILTGSLTCTLFGRRRKQLI